jgi:carbamoyl-phosphate synthase large subunit
MKTDFIVEEYLPNRDFCFMSIWKDGTLVTSMVRERLSWVGHRMVGSGGTSKLNQVVHSDKVNATALEAIRAVSPTPHGIFCVDLKGDRRGAPRPTEINCRFTTNVHYLTLASLKLGHPEWNFPWLAARICLGEKIPLSKTLNALPANLWFTKNTDMGFTMVEGEKWRAEDYT